MGRAPAALLARAPDAAVTYPAPHPLLYVQNVYTDPAAPVYIVQATAGAVLDYEKWIAPTNWSLVRDGDNYGFGMMTLNTTADGAHRVLSYTFIDIDNKVHVRVSSVRRRLALRCARDPYPLPVPRSLVPAPGHVVHRQDRVKAPRPKAA